LESSYSQHITYQLNLQATTARLPAVSFSKPMQQSLTKQSLTKQSLTKQPLTKEPLTQQPLAQQFKAHLNAAKNLSQPSIKNYVSDINHFLNWLAVFSSQPTIAPHHITASNCKSYQQYLFKSLSSNSIPNSTSNSTSNSTPAPSSLSLTTANRHLSSLRHFCRYLESSNQLDHNPGLNLPNLDSSFSTYSQTQILNHFSSFLKTQKLSQSTIKNYVSDINQYLLWTQNNIKITDSKIRSRIS